MNKENDDTQMLAFKRLCNTIKALRDPVTGCPWDLAQTHKTLRKFMIEEAYEAIEVMDPLIPNQLLDELGDVLLQVILNSQIASEANLFSLNEVIQNLDEKMRRRHPHVFEKKSNAGEISANSVEKKWEEIKSQEKKDSPKSKGIFSSLKKSQQTPASQLAVKIGDIAKTVHFDWSSISEVFNQVTSEIEELKIEIDRNPNSSESYEELGDVYFTLAQLARHLHISPEICAFDANLKFLRRFQLVEDIALTKNIELESCSSDELTELWHEAKKIERTGKVKNK